MPNSPCSPCRAFRLKAALDRVANVGGDVLEVGQIPLIARDAVAVILDREVMSVVLLAADDGDVLRVGIDRVLHELRDGLERIALREGDDADRVPMVADASLPLSLLFAFMP